MSQGRLYVFARPRWRQCQFYQRTNVTRVSFALSCIFADSSRLIFWRLFYSRKHLEYESKLIENVLHIPRNLQNISNDQSNQVIINQIHQGLPSAQLNHKSNKSNNTNSEADLSQACSSSNISNTESSTASNNNKNTTSSTHNNSNSNTSNSTASNTNTNSNNFDKNDPKSR